MLQTITETCVFEMVWDENESESKACFCSQQLTISNITQKACEQNVCQEGLNAANYDPYAGNCYLKKCDPDNILIAKFTGPKNRILLRV